jgi:hypothetical protein
MIAMHVSSQSNFSFFEASMMPLENIHNAHSLRREEVLRSSRREHVALHGSAGSKRGFCLSRRRSSWPNE